MHGVWGSGLWPRVVAGTVGVAALTELTASHAVGGGGSGTRVCWGLVPTIVGTSGDDVLRGSGSDVIVGGAGRDRIFGGPGFDWICGDGGDDVVSGEGGRALVRGGAGNDLLRGGAGGRPRGEGDHLQGGEGRDRLFGSRRHDTSAVGPVVT
jgi:Ca2+-binding RTX toxin-like protein